VAAVAAFVAAAVAAEEIDFGLVEEEAEEVGLVGVEELGFDFLVVEVAVAEVASAALGAAVHSHSQQRRISDHRQDILPND
jgi:hypothetical protein